MQATRGEAGDAAGGCAPRPGPIRPLAPEAVAAAVAELLEGARDGRAAVLAARFDPPALVLGSAQSQGDADAEACAARGLAVVRRGSGGGAVLCDHGLLEVDVALPPDHRLVEADVTGSYRWFGEAWRDALEALGLPTRLVGMDEARAAGAGSRAAARAACWAGLSPCEVLTEDGRKLVGLSQRRRGGAVLLQSGLACTGAPARVLDLLRLDPAVRTAAARALARTASLDEVAPTPLTPATVWARLGPLLAERISAAAWGAGQAGG